MDTLRGRQRYTPVTLLEQEAGFLRPVLLVALRLVDAVAVARVLPVQVLLGINATDDNDALRIDFHGDEFLE